MGLRLVTLNRLSSDAVKKVSGPSWDPLRPAFLEISERLLEVSPQAVGVLTTIYVKYQVSSATNSAVYAVVWLKSSKQIVVGLALPEATSSSSLVPPPRGMTYKGLTRYFTVQSGELIPEALREWARMAFEQETAHG